MRDIVHDRQFEPRFDALVVDEAQDQDTCWSGSEPDKTECGWWEVYWKLLRENTSARMGIFYDPDQRQLFRRKERFEATRVFERLSQPAHASLLFALRYSLPIFRFLKTLRSEATSSLVNSLRYRTALPEGPDVELYEVKPERTAVKVEEVVTRWVDDGFCRLDEILILSPHGTKAKTALVHHSNIGEWPLVSFGVRKPGRTVTAFDQQGPASAGPPPHGSMRSPQWMTTETTLAFFAGDSGRARRGACRRELEEAAGLGVGKRIEKQRSGRELGQLVGGPVPLSPPELASTSPIVAMFALIVGVESLMC